MLLLASEQRGRLARWFGTIRNAITSAAGADRIEAIRRCATASGLTRPRMLP